MKKDISNDEIFKAMNIYLTEWIHRDKHMWSQTYKFFFASLVVMFLPNLTNKLGFSIPVSLNKHYVFPILGLVLSFAFFYVSIGYAKRLRACGKTYNNLIHMLPKKLQRVSIHELQELKIVNHAMAYVMPTAMFLVLIIIGALLIILE